MAPAEHPLDNLDDEAWSALVHLARSLHLKNAELQPTLDAIVEHAVATIDPAHHAGVIVVVGEKLTPQATIGAPPLVLDLLQEKTGSGPCVDAARQQCVITVEDVAGDGRWPDFSAAATALGVASMLCVPLWVDEMRLGTLSLYGQKPHAFGDDHLRLADLYAAHAAIALADALRADQLHGALRNRDLIGQAKGILIERLKLTPQEAFDCLSRASQATNERLLVVAQHLVDSGELIGGRAS